MLSLEEDCFVNCPYCMESIKVRIDFTGGQNQFFTYDCEICCQPISIQIKIDVNGIIDLTTEKES